MKDAIVRARPPFSGELPALHTWHRRFVDAWFLAVPPTHPDRLAKQALLLHELELGKAEGGLFERRDVLDARTQFVLPQELPKFWLPVSETAPHLDAVHRRLSILDLGAGVGAAGAATALYFAQQGVVRDIQWVAVEADKTLAPAFEQVVDTVRSVSGLNLHVTRHGIGLEKYLASRQVERFDLVFLPGQLGGFFPPDASPEPAVEFVTKVLREKVKKSGFLILVEPSIKRSSRFLSTVLGALQAAGMPTFAPCGTGGTCPFLATREKFCIHSVPTATHPLVQSVAARANLRSHEVHFSYGVLSPKGLRKSQWEGGAPEGHSTGRVVSFPDRRPHGFAYQLCSEKGVSFGVAPRMLPEDSGKGNRLIHGTEVLVASDWSPE